MYRSRIVLDMANTVGSYVGRLKPALSVVEGRSGADMVFGSVLRT